MWLPACHAACTRYHQANQKRKKCKKGPVRYARNTSKSALMWLPRILSVLSWRIKKRIFLFALCCKETKRERGRVTVSNHASNSVRLPCPNQQLPTLPHSLPAGCGPTQTRDRLPTNHSRTWLGSAPPTPTHTSSACRMQPAPYILGKLAAAPSFHHPHMHTQALLLLACRMRPWPTPRSFHSPASLSYRYSLHLLQARKQAGESGVNVSCRRVGMLRAYQYSVHLLRRR